MVEAIRTRPTWKLACDELRVARGGRVVLQGISFEFRPGECISLIGPNGSGKTTLMLALLGLLSPVGGSIRLDGEDLHRIPARRRARFAAYVPQIVDRIPAFTVRDVVAAGRFPHVAALRPLAAADHAAIDTALAQSGLSDLALRPISAVSGGERQKALIAAAMAQDAEVMCLDEPNTALDPAYQVELARVLQSWHADGRALVLISHDLQLPAVLGGRVIALRAGRVIADDRADELLDPERLSQVYDTHFVFAETPGGGRVVLPDWWRAESTQSQS